MRALVATCKIWQVWKWISIIHHLSVGCSVFHSSLNGVRRGRSIIGAMFHPSCRSDLYLGTTISSCSSVWDRIKFPECSGGMFFLKATNFVVAQHRNKWIQFWAGQRNWAKRPHGASPDLWKRLREHSISLPEQKKQISAQQLPEVVAYSSPPGKWKR